MYAGNGIGGDCAPGTLSFRCGRPGRSPGARTGDENGLGPAESGMARRFAESFRLDAAGLAEREVPWEAGGDREMVGEGGGCMPWNALPRSSSVAGPNVMSGMAACKVLGRSRTLSMSFVETARARLPMLCWMSMLGLVMVGEASELMEAISNAGLEEGSAEVDMQSCCCAVVYVGSSEYLRRLIGID